MAEETVTVYECPRCNTLIPYLMCPHDCPWDEEEDEGFCEDLLTFYEELNIGVQEEEFRPFEEIFEELREPYPN